MVKNQIVILFILLYLTSLYAEKILVKESMFENAFNTSLLLQNNNKIIIKVNVNSFDIKNVNEGKFRFFKTSIEGGRKTNAIGMPELPIIKIPIALNDFSKPKNIKIKEIDRIIYKLGVAYPCQYPSIETEEQGEFVINDQYYQTGFIFPEKNIHKSKMKILRKINFIDIEVCPFKYNAKDSSLILISDFNVEVNLENNQSGKKRNVKVIKKRKNELYKKLFVNYNDSFIKKDNITVYEEGGK